MRAIPFGADKLASMLQGWMPRLSMFIALLATRGTVAIAAEEPTYPVTIILPTDANLTKEPLRVYRWDGSENAPTFQAEIAHDKEKQIDIKLQAGRFAIEIGKADKGQITLLRQSILRVPNERRITLSASQFHFGAFVKGEKASLKQAAVLKIHGGEFRWQANDPKSAPPALLLSPGEDYTFSCVGETKDTVLAIWHRAKPRTGAQFNDTEATACVTFAARPQTPALIESTVSVGFPETWVPIQNPLNRRLLTNRNRAMIDYRIKTDAGETLKFYRRGYDLTPTFEFQFGGPLKPSLCAFFGWAEEGSGWRPEFWNRVDLVDPGGHEVDQGSSKFDFSSQLFIEKNDNKIKLADAPPSWEKFDPKTVLAEIHYKLGGEQQAVSCHGEELKAVKSEHFKIVTPAAWQWRSRLFLAMLERVRILDQNNTHRPGPVSSKVDWRINSDSAKSIVASPSGGGHDIWMSFPFWTFEQMFDPFDEPWFGNHDPYVCHEVLHTFGYNHGDEMSQLEWKGEAQYRELRWQSAESGVWQVWPE